MGTSKGYIPPTSIPWQQAKRAVTAFRGDTLSGDLMHNAVSAYANARLGLFTNPSFTSSKVAKAVSSIATFFGASTTGSIGTYLHSIGHDDLLGKSTLEIFQLLLYDFTDNSTTADDRNLYYVISKVLENLGIITDDDFSSIDPEEFLIEFLAEFICADFDYCFEEQLRKGVSPSEFDSILNRVHSYINNAVYTLKTSIHTRNINYHNLHDDMLVQNIILETYAMFSSM